MSAKTEKQPSRDLNHYTVTRHVLLQDEPSDVLDANFKQFSAATDGFFGTMDAYSYPLGFEFSFNGYTYTHVCPSNTGFLALVPWHNSGGADPSDLFDTGDISKNYDVSLASNYTLLMPWGDDMTGIPIGTQQAYDYSIITYEQKERMDHGLDAIPHGITSTAHSIGYHARNTLEGKVFITRWRTHSMSPTITLGNMQYASALKYEVHIYENGKIEFRYASRNIVKPMLTAAQQAIINKFETASIVVISSTGGTIKFRDLSYGLGHNDGLRVEDVLGGCRDIIYQENDSYGNAPTMTGYSTNLNAEQHWPGARQGAMVFTLQPPHNKRIVLPRNEIRRQDAVGSMSSLVRMFDDRRTLVYGTGSYTKINTSSPFAAMYPTRLPRFYGRGTYDVNVVARQDLFHSSSNLITSSIDRACDDFTYSTLPEVSAQYSEASNPNLIMGTDPFFLTGSSLDAADTSLLQPLSAKTQMQFILPVTNTTQMLSCSSCIYYYDKKQQRWMMPALAAKDIASFAQLDDAVYSSAVLHEDWRGFNPIGRFVVSGSRWDIGGGITSDAIFENAFTQKNAQEALATSFAKNITINSDYDADDKQVIELNLDSPFILEKAVIKIPIEAGPAWFRDKTCAFYALHQAMKIKGGAIDLGGPALTFALFNQNKFVRYYPPYYVGDNVAQSPSFFATIYQRDLIMSGTITHVYDDVSELVLSKFPPFSYDYQLRPSGFRAYAQAPASAIVHPTSAALQFTGSVQVNCAAESTNGFMPGYNQSAGSGAAAAQFIRGLLTSSARMPTWRLTNFSWSVNNNGIILGNCFDPYNTARLGFTPSDRLDFGREYRLPDMSSDALFPNAFYLGTYQTGSTTIPTKFSDILNSIVAPDSISAITYTQYSNTTQSPYLLMPHDKLVLAISKTRPAYYADPAFIESFVGYEGVGAAYRFSGSYYGGATYISASHDIKLGTGNIELTLYGSYLRSETEIHPKSHTIDTPNVYETVIGDVPVTDQYEGARSWSYSGAYNDGYYTGSLTSPPYERSNIFSKSFMTYSDYLTSIIAPNWRFSNILFPSSPRLSEQLQPWSEFAGIVHVVDHTSQNEQFYDSLMPSIADVMKADGCGIAVINNVGGWVTSHVDKQTNGWIFFESTTSDSTFQSGFDQVNNWNWMKAFPFEPRYHNAARQQRFQNGVLARYSLTVDGGAETDQIQTTQIPAQQVDSLYLGFVTLFSRFNITNNSHFLCDSFLDGRTHNTGTISTNDACRVLFGFGDRKFISGSFDITHMYEPRKSFHSLYDTLGCLWEVGPQIRGWKYGVYSGIPTYSKSYWRRGSYGQFRDMLEQRPMTKFFITETSSPTITSSPVKVSFRDINGRTTNPENTWSQNLSNEATSSLPYFDGETRNRGAINLATLNQSIVSLSSDLFSNVSL